MNNKPHWDDYSDMIAHIEKLEAALWEIVKRSEEDFAVKIARTALEEDDFVGKLP
jgi:hypothetical protein